MRAKTRHSGDARHAGSVAEPAVARPVAAAVDPADRRALNLPAATHGVVITAVDPASDAAEKGLQRGDVIISVNRQAVTQPAQVAAAVAAARQAGRTSVLLLVKRGNLPEAFVGIEIPQAKPPAANLLLACTAAIGNGDGARQAA